MLFFQVAFNPVTVNSIKRVLSKICRAERIEVNDVKIDDIAKASGGDIRNAVTSLQYFCLKLHPVQSSSLLKSLPSCPERKMNESDGFSMPFGKDATLSLFHALGKFLHNKRESCNITPGILLELSYMYYVLQVHNNITPDLSTNLLCCLPYYHN